jgi:AraC family transcriptional regulator of adaptative response / DNA-3-methyladenine glycosylase II
VTPGPGGAAALDRKACYAAFKNHDASFDGRIFICVASTGIYCRPVCRTRPPKEDNCTFQASAAAAEAAGYRPCLKCRPELAPGFAPIDSVARLARRAAELIEDGGLDGGGMAALAGSLGVTDRHLRRAFAAAYGVPPARYLQTRRLLLSKSLLTDTELPITEIAFAAGFGSVRRFNSLFKSRYRLSPAALRKTGAAFSRRGGEGATLFLGYRPPFGWNKLLSFLADRAIPGVESARDGAYRRTVVMRSGGERLRGWIAVENMEGKNALAATLAPSLFPVLPKILARIRNLFDLDNEPGGVFAALAAMNRLKPGICVPGTRLPGCFDPFEMAVRAVLGQQITVKAACTLAGRIARAFGEPMETPFAELTHGFPDPETLGGLPEAAGNRLGPLGIIGSRARAISALAQSLSAGTITLSPLADPEEEVGKLLSLPGVGHWTAQYLAMRALRWPDAFPHTDYGLRKALAGPTSAQLLEMSGQWRPWRAYAAMNLWNSLA